MADVANRLDEIERNIMAGLKDFQQATVNRIDELYRQGQKRILISDEVGLGKTLIARGTVAKVAKIQKESGDKLVKVVYICSNTAIAEQNLNKLRVTDDLRVERADSSRLSMQHLNIFMQESDKELLNSYIQLIPLTPDTSFRPTSGQGRVEERALMYAILKRIDLFAKYKRELEVLMQYDASKAWTTGCKDTYENKVLECDDKTHGRYLKYMLSKVRSGLLKKRSDKTTIFDDLYYIFKAIRRNGYEYVSAGDELGELRMLFSQISIDKLHPDLVIMDEFQRFKYLIESDDDSEIGMLRHKFFNSQKVKMLLLSATPYKMYSTLEEIDENDTDEYYEEFLKVVEFLNVNEEDNKHFRTVWDNYSVQLKELTKGSTSIISAKNAAQEAMYEHICRTERVSESQNADMIDDSDVKKPLTVSVEDVKSYIEAEKLIEDINAPFNMPVDYIKSTPYILSFMRDYQIKRYIERYFAKHTDELSKVNRDSLWLKRRTLDNYDKLPNANARLDRVMEHVFKNNAELLLWVPPCKPYYQPQGVYKDSENFSKTLIFSSWEMVPRMLAGMLSYEAECKTIGKLAKIKHDDAHYFYSGERRYPLPRLYFTVKNDTPYGMPLFCLLYPSVSLAKCYNPIDCLNRHLSLKEIEKEIHSKLEEKLQKIPYRESRSQDDRWYYLAPLLLDQPQYVSEWLESDDKLLGHDDSDDKDKKHKGFLTHLDTLKNLYYDVKHYKSIVLGKKPDDLLDALTNMAIASPAVCIYRTYKKYSCGAGQSNVCLPSQVAKAFINRMNTPESTAIVKLSERKNKDDTHWQSVLTYCKDGNMQAMFDEYAHIMSNGMDHNSTHLQRLNDEIIESMKVRAASYTVDTYNSFCTRAKGGKDKPAVMRTHFAAAFTKGDGNDKDTNRKVTIRNAFNSPFRPFVLASTSIGQEGLDFHNYCRRIVHWNLPSNPIDLEQREGRINRFECLAIRQNIANRYGSISFKKNIWTEMFEIAAKKEKSGNCSDIIPYWGLRPTEDMVKIERIVPMYPCSRDETAYERLIKILSLYRLTLGQARQEELLEYLFKNLDESDDVSKLFINLSPFYREK